MHTYACTINYECSIFTINVYNVHNHFDNVHYQVEAWISEKISVATDESYKDPTNLKAKLQKHQAFEAEITANEERIQTLAKVIL